MPGFDGTGPRGAGPMTGGARGYCTFGWNRLRQRVFGFRGAPRGGLYGRNRWWNTAPTYEDASMSDLTGLTAQIERLSERVESLSARLDAQDRGGQ